MNEQDPNSARARLQQLRAIPERQRTDAEWDELNELEIRMAAGNRGGGDSSQQNQRGNVPQHQQPQNQNRGPGGGQQHQGRRPGKRHHQKPKPQR